jgi:telomerase Cajal body protein 1
MLSPSSPVLDFAWYPGASVSDPSTFCFVASVRECPVKLLDAASGRVCTYLFCIVNDSELSALKLRASYKIVDHRERQVAPHCLAFNCNASQ